MEALIAKAPSFFEWFFVGARNKLAYGVKVQSKLVEATWIISSEAGFWKGVPGDLSQWTITVCIQFCILELVGCQFFTGKWF